MRRAAALDASPWVAALALAVGAVVARAVVHLLPASGSDVAAARALGIVSVTILANHSEIGRVARVRPRHVERADGERRRVARMGGRGGAARAGERRSDPVSSRRVGALKLAVVALALAVPFARLWTARAAWISPWVVSPRKARCSRGSTRFCVAAPCRATCSVRTLRSPYGRWSCSSRRSARRSDFWRAGSWR